MGRRILRSRRSPIPFVDLNARTVETTFDSSNYPTGETYTTFTLSTCTVQPASGTDLRVLPEGLRDSEVYNIFTETDAQPALEGTTSKSDEVFLSSDYASDEGWFVVVKRKAWRNNIIPHYHLMVVRKNDIGG